MLLNYGFREKSNDIDAFIHASSVIDKHEKADVYTIRFSCIIYDSSPLTPKNIPYLECFSTKTPWWIALQLSYILMHRTDELLGEVNISYILSYVNIFYFIHLKIILCYVP